MYAAMIIVGIALCVVARWWWTRTAHTRAVWRNARHDAEKVAIVLELEERVLALEREHQRDRATMPAR